jgi:AcrR family transcriptional regulator
VRFVTVPADFRRARSPEHKQQRALDLLEAARELATAGGARTVTLTAIATRAGVHPSAVRRYFDSREDMLLNLAAGAWREWAAALSGQFERSGRLTVQGVAETLAVSLAERPLFCDLLAHASLSLEREVPVTSARSYKIAALDSAYSASAAVGRALPSLPRDGGHEAVTAATALAAMLWQYAHPPETLQRLYAEDPRLGHDAADFTARLTQMLDDLLAGILHRSAPDGSLGGPGGAIASR